MKNKAKFKNHYILPYYRGRGFFKTALDWSIRKAKEKGYRSVEANCTSMSLNEYLKRGAIVVKDMAIAKQVILSI